MFWFWFFLVLLVFFIFSTFKIVPQNHISIVQFLGKYNRTLRAGLNILIPVFEKVAVRINLAVRNFLFDLTAVSKDKVTIHLKANLIYSINPEQVADYWYKLSDPKQTIASFVENYVRSFVAGQTHEELLERREEIAVYLMEHLDEKFSSWGIILQGFQIMDIMFPSDINDAMSRVVASQRLKEAAVNEAEAQKIRVVKDAEAEKDSRILLGEGVAGERQAIIDGLKNSIDDMQDIPGLNAHEVMNLIVMSQYFDTVKAIGETENTKVMFMDPAPEGASNMLKELTAALEATSTSTATPAVSKRQRVAASK